MSFDKEQLDTVEKFLDIAQKGMHTVHGRAAWGSEVDEYVKANERCFKALREIVARSRELLAEREAKDPEAKKHGKRRQLVINASRQMAEVVKTFSALDDVGVDTQFLKEPVGAVVLGMIILTMEAAEKDKADKEKKEN